MHPLRIFLLVLIFATTASLEGIVHVVKKGENLTIISKAYNVSVAELKKVNNIENATAMFLLPCAPVRDPAISVDYV